MGSANTWVVLKNSSRPTLRDQGQDQDRQCEDQDQDQDCKKSVSSGLETKTAVSRTTRLVILWIYGTWHNAECQKLTIAYPHSVFFIGI